MAGTEHDKILDAPDDTPVPCRVDFTLVSSVKPSVAQCLRGFLGTVPVARKDARAAHYDFVVFAEVHFDAADRWPNPPGLDVIWVIHRADGSGLGQSIYLQDRNAQHHEVELCFHH